MQILFDPKNRKLVFAGAVIIILVALILLYVPQSGIAPAPSENSAQNAGGTNPPPYQPYGTNKPPAPSAAPQQKPRIVLLAPLPGAQWGLGQNHEITWSRAAELKGSIALLNAQTKITTGWIHSSLDPRQVSFTWDTRDVFVARGSPQKKNVDPGTYILKINFDGPVTPIESSPITIVYLEQLKAVTHTVAIAGSTFNPKNTTAKRGDKIIFENHDSATHQFRVDTTPYTLKTGESLTFDTNVLTIGTYDLSSDMEAVLRGTLTVQ